APGPAAKPVQVTEELPGPCSELVAPRTLPQAIRAYLRCLCYGPCPSEKNGPSEKVPEEGKKQPSEDKNSSEPTVQRNDKDKEKEKNKGKEKEKDKETGKDKESDKDKENGKDKEEAKDKEQWYSAHVQGTVVTQAHDHFRSPYAGPNSLPSVEPYVTSETTT